MAPPPTQAAALRPLAGLVGRGSDLARLLGHLDAGRSVRILAPRGAGTTALLRAVCGSQPRRATRDGVLALPTGLPLTDLPEAARRLLPGANRPLDTQRLLVLLDERDLEARDVQTLQQMVPSSLLVVTGDPDADPAGLVPAPLSGLSEHHAVALMEAAIGRSLSVEEGRAARWVAAAVGGMPTWLVQAAGAVREGGLSFSEIRDLLDDPPRPGALTVALQNALDDDLHVALSTLRTFADVPVPVSVLAAAIGCDADTAQRRVRRLFLLGLAGTDGREGWTAASAVADVSDPVRAGVADRLTPWLSSEAAAAASLTATAAVLSVVGDRVAAADVHTAAPLAAAALDGLPLGGLEQSMLLLEETVHWAGSESSEEGVVDDTPAAAVGGAETPPVHDEEGSLPAPLSGPPRPAPDPATSPASPWNSRLALLVSDWRGLVVVAVAAGAVLLGALLAVPMVQGDRTVDEPVRAELDLGTVSVGESGAATLQLNLAGRTVQYPVSLSISGPDPEAFALDPLRCDDEDCRATVTFTPDRPGAHLSTVTATDPTGLQHGTVELSGSGTGDPAPKAATANLGVTLYPAQPSPLPSGDQAVVPVGVRNAGPEDSTGARLVVTVPVGVEASASGCTLDGTGLVCPIAELLSGDQVTVEVTLTIPEGSGPVQVRAAVEPTSDIDPSSGDDAAGFTYPVSG